MRTPQRPLASPADPPADPPAELRLAPCLTPHGRLVLRGASEAPALAPDLARRLGEAFARGSGHALLRLGACEVGVALPPAFAFWREFGARYVTTLCTEPEAAEGESPRTPVRLPAPPTEALEHLARAVPPMAGAEYLTPAVLAALWDETGRAFSAELAASQASLPEFLQRLHPAWNLVGRVHFNLAENRTDEAAPFAFLATYTTRLSAHGKAQHLPLGAALRESADAANRDRLLALLLPVQRAAARCAWLREMVDADEIYHPLRWTPREALRLLRDVPALESSGVVVRMPAGWRAHRPPRPQVGATLGSRPPSGLGQEALLDFQMSVTLEGEVLTPKEIRALLGATEGLALVRGRWVEIDAAGLKATMDRFRQAEELAAAEGLNFLGAMRALAGADIAPGELAGQAHDEGSRVVAGAWLAETLAGLRSPEGLAPIDPGRALIGALRPYQQAGLRWLHLLSRLGLGACLADDMGLGKTIQILALLLVEQARKEKSKRPSLLIAPASLLANWAAEIERFAPSLKVFVAHSSALPAAELGGLKGLSADRIRGKDLVITTYGSILRLPWLVTTQWHLLVLDEAQAIKNPNARQTRAAKQLKARARIALTGTPIENRLSDLWSIFDFLNPGLLGSAKQFATYTKRLAERPHEPFGPLRELVRPYILRRLKTDRSVIADLPEKIELTAFCPLGKKQAALYQESVRELAQRLEITDGIRRRGLVLAFLMRFKQICNHPSQWLGDGDWAEGDSGKWSRLREIAEVVAAKQEKILVFTQFREMTAPLAAFLGQVFGRPGLVLSGATEVKARRELVRRFQEDESVPFFILSLKAGGTGLNLTAAQHVVHFDRWWNPAVENQATDRAFRIGQTRNVLVHKFVCRGTVEEKIDQLIESKRGLARDLLEGDAGPQLTELNDADLLRLVALDLSSALGE